MFVCTWLSYSKINPTFMSGVLLYYFLLDIFNNKKGSVFDEFNEKNGKNDKKRRFKENSECRNH